MNYFFDMQTYGRQHNICTTLPTSNTQRWVLQGSKLFLATMLGVILAACSDTTVTSNPSQVSPPSLEADSHETATVETLSEAEDDIVTITTLIEQGDTHFENREYEQALEKYNRAIALDADNPVAYTGRGRIYVAQEEYQQAIEDYASAIEIDTMYAPAYSNRGVAHYNLGQYEQSLEDYNRAIQLDPNDAIAFSRRGITHVALENYEQAVEDLDRAAILAPNEVIVYLNRGFAYNEMGDHDRAIDEFTRAIKIDPENLVGYNQRGFAYEQLQRSADAFNDYNRAIEIDPKYAASYYGRGMANKDLGRIRDAISDFERYIALSNDNDKYWKEQAEQQLQELRNNPHSAPDRLAEWATVFVSSCTTEGTAFTLSAEDIAVAEIRLNLDDVAGVVQYTREPYNDDPTVITTYYNAQGQKFDIFDRDTVHHYGQSRPEEATTLSILFVRPREEAVIYAVIETIPPIGVSAVMPAEVGVSCRNRTRLANDIEPNGGVLIDVYGNGKEAEELYDWLLNP